MRTRSMMVGGILWLVLAAHTGTLARAQNLPQPWEVSAGRAESLWYGQVPPGDVGEKTECLAPCSPCPRVYGYAEGLFLQRSNGCFDQPVIVATIDGNPAATLLSTSDLDFDYDPALRVLLGFRVHDGWAIEGSYLGFCDSEAATFLAPQTNMTFPGGLGPVSNVFGNPDRIWASYSSSLHSAELNLVCCCGGCSTCGACKTNNATPGACGGRNTRCRTVEWFAGFRYFNLAEDLRIYGERDQTTASGTIGVESGVYDIRTSNNLYGAQVGGRLRRWGERLGCEATGKAGVFGNDAQQEQYVIDFDRFELRPTTGNQDYQVAFVGELNLTGIYRLSEVWNLRAGYNLVWVSGLALAPDQLDFSGTLPAGNRLHSTGSMFLHGVSCGVEARW